MAARIVLSIMEHIDACPVNQDSIKFINLLHILLNVLIHLLIVLYQTVVTVILMDIVIHAHMDLLQTSIELHV